MSNVLHINDKEEFEAYLADNPNVVVDFWATWCGPCAKFKPHFESASEQLNDVVFIAVDIEAAPWASSDYGVMSVPTVMLYRDGEYVKNLQERTVLKLVPEINS